MRKEQRYHLPLDVIIATMQGLREPVALHAHMPALPGYQEVDAHIVVDANGLRRCIVTEQPSGRTLCEQEEALRLVQTCGLLDWTLQSQMAQPSPALTHSPSARIPLPQTTSRQLPSRQVELTPGQLAGLPPAQKKVFALVNGAHSVEQIALLLRKSVQEVFHILFELKQQHLIDM